MTHGVCQECGAEFDYELKPGFPRKYCVTCGDIKKQSYAAKQSKKEFVDNIEVPYPEVEVPVEKPGMSILDPDIRLTKIEKVNGSKYDKDPVGLAVEVFCAIRALNPEETHDNNSVMNGSIYLVKQAQEAFK